MSNTKGDKNGDKNMNLSLDECLRKTEPYLRDTIINLQNSDIWKIQLAIAINFIFSKDAEEERVIHSKGENIKFTSYNDANKFVEELFDLLRLRYQVDLEISMRESDRFNLCIKNTIK